MSNQTNETEALYNGIRLPTEWPPKTLDPSSRKVIRPPYLDDIPNPIPIHVGRQLFVDDFLIEHTELDRQFHKPRLHEANPILEPTTETERNDGICPVASPFNDGVFFDDKDQLFKMWYHAGWFDGTGYATSEDGIHWSRPTLDVVPDTNLVIPPMDLLQRDGAGVWIDHEAKDPAERYKLFLYFRKRPSGHPAEPVPRAVEWEGGKVYTSPDGIHWRERANTGSPCGDNTTFFYNPFRKVWVYSIRTHDGKVGRVRSYREHQDFTKGAAWTPEDVVYWYGADELDLPEPSLGYETQLYNIDAVAYESLLLGLHMVHRGPPNEVCEKGGFPKITDVQLGFSRDGFHWHRPDRSSFIPSSRVESSWNRAYIHSAGGVCLVVGSELYFYFGAWSGISPRLGSHMYAGGSTGLAILRRDGFASLNAGDAQGYLLTRPVTFSGKQLFVNCNTVEGELRVEVLDESNQVIAPFSLENSIPVQTDNVTQPIRWQNGASLEDLSNTAVKFRFWLRNGQLFSFWVSQDESGASHGYVAAGGPGFEGPIDTIGRQLAS